MLTQFSKTKLTVLCLLFLMSTAPLASEQTVTINSESLSIINVCATIAYKQSFCKGNGNYLYNASPQLPTRYFRHLLSSDAKNGAQYIFTDNTIDNNQASYYYLKVACNDKSSFRINCSTTMNLKNVCSQIIKTCMENEAKNIGD